MAEIAPTLLPYLATIIGFLIVYVLSGIKSEIRDVRKSVSAMEESFRESLASHDRRITVIETRCSMEHDK